MARRSSRRPLQVELLEPRQLLAFDPSGLEQEFIQLVNRMRSDPQGELGRMVDRLNPISSPSPEINSQLQFWHVDGNVLSQQWQSLLPAAPLAWNEQLWNSALGHDQEMIRQRNQQHQLPGEPDPGQRMQNAGYPSPFSWGESIAAHCTTVFECHAAFAIDWGPGPNGIQSPPGHRNLLVNPRFREIGIAVVQHARTDPQDVGPLVVTKDFGVRANMGNSFVVGAVFNDANDSTWYNNGEGLGGVTIRFVGDAGTFDTTSLTAGGYQVQLPAGVYAATASGGGLREPLIFANIVVGGDNVWVNFRQQNNALPPDRFEPNNDFAKATQLPSGDQNLQGLSLHLPDNADYYRWTASVGGQATARAKFVHSRGNLDLSVYDDARREVASSNSTSDLEQIVWPVTAGSSWYVVVRGAQRSVNPDYKLELDAPGGGVPSAVDDKTATDRNKQVVIDILANDSDADGDLVPSSVQITQPPQFGSISVNPQNGSVTYTPQTGFLGADRFRYVVRDATNLSAPEANVIVAVVDYDGIPWQNPQMSVDADGSGGVVLQDALIIINRLNQVGPGQLSAQPTGVNSPPPYVDTSGDGFLTANDVLRVINYLNRGLTVAPEGESSAILPATDSLPTVVAHLPGDDDSTSAQTKAAPFVRTSKLAEMPERPSDDRPRTSWQLNPWYKSLVDRDLVRARDRVAATDELLGDEESAHQLLAAT